MVCYHCGGDAGSSANTFCMDCKTLRTDINAAGNRYHEFEEEARQAKLRFEMAEAATQAARDRYHTLRAVFASRKKKIGAHAPQTA